MVARVPLLGMLIAMSLLLVENLGANAYIAAKRSRVAHVSEKQDSEQMRDQRAVRLERLIRELEIKDREIARMYPHIDEVELDRVRLQVQAKVHEIEQLRSELGR